MPYVFYWNYIQYSNQHTESKADFTVLVFYSRKSLWSCNGSCRSLLCYGHLTAADFARWWCHEKMVRESVLQLFLMTLTLFICMKIVIFSLIQNKMDISRGRKEICGFYMGVVKSNTERWSGNTSLAILSQRSNLGSSALSPQTNCVLYTQYLLGAL